MRIVIEGRVQGVYFRAFTRDAASELGLRGWVRNQSDGSVEVAVAGDGEAVERLKSRLRVGPPSARVVALHEEILEAAPAEEGFEIRY